MARLRTTVLILGAAAMAISAAQSAGAQPPASPNGTPPPDQGQYDQGQYNVPPPPGYQPGDEPAETSDQARAQDEQYSYAAEQWAARNCVAQHANSTAAGVVIGGLLGAALGAGIGGRYNGGAGALAGGVVGATAGGAIGNASANSNPNCPPGYGLRPGAPVFYPGPIYGPVVYAAPGWYDPWIWYGGRWIYRPYPYHRYWYRTHYR
ncbi:MAG TPA: hypothetical protein VHZ26_04665 [Caulobacteraceae bacterium]|jgi:hypothetical protein|nr:hypothetical protein [Caulobacteraceae bacterium]